ncbi:MAG: hypothetical protein IH598_09580 [Bacteroidales bacterium]|nr:hypothetical protein [Bacteroidales bacterium]
MRVSSPSANCRSVPNWLLKPEPDNPHDENAVAIGHNDHKPGFIPRSSNQPIAAILNAGHPIFEARIRQIKPDAHPENQVHVVVCVVTPKQ